MLWNGSEEVGNVTSQYAEDEGTDYEDGDNDSGRPKGRQNPNCSVYEMYNTNSIILVLIRCFDFGAQIWVNALSLGRLFLGGGGEFVLDQNRRAFG